MFNQKSVKDTQSANLKIQVQHINSLVADKFKVELTIARLDTLNEHWGGNKYFKLKYNLEAAALQNKSHLLTFGGAYSNHIAATAAAGKAHGLKTTGIIRGEKLEVLNPTLQFARDCGMELLFVNRTDYRNKKELSQLIQTAQLPLLETENYYIIPEGGSNELGFKGCTEIMELIDSSADIVCCSCGTGTTFAGIVSSLKENQKGIGFSSLKGADFLKNEIAQTLDLYTTELTKHETKKENWEVQTNYHFGGYGKVKPELLNFCKYFLETQKIELDLVYTGKMFFGIFDLIEKGYFKEGTKILALHTGGTQGNKGFKDFVH